MKYGKVLFTLLFAMFLFGGMLVADVPAQRRTSVSRVTHRPIIVRRYAYYDPFWRDRYWGYSRFYNPYLEYVEQRNYLESRVRGNRRELEKHRAKYSADGVITAKEREELNDDIRDVQESVAALNYFNRRY